MYNPAHLISKLQSTGFTVTLDDKNKFNVNYMIGEKRFSIIGLQYFLGLICFHFYKEEEIIDMFNKSISAMEEAGIKPNTKCEFRFNQSPHF